MNNIEPTAVNLTAEGQPESQNKTSEVGKMKYEKPVLIEYGTLAKLTRGGGGGGNDGGSPTMICL